MVLEGYVLWGKPQRGTRGFGLEFYEQIKDRHQWAKLGTLTQQGLIL